MNKRIGFLLALLMCQHIVALDITHTLTPVHIAREVIVVDTLEEAHELLGRCSVEERIEVARALQLSMLEWVATFGSRDGYEYMLKAHYQQQAIMGKLFCGAFIGLALGCAGLAAYKYVTTKDLVLKSAHNFYAMHKVTNPDWFGRSQVVNGVPITSPYFVDGHELASLSESIVNSFDSFKSIETTLAGAGVGSVLATVFGVVSKEASDNQSIAQHNLDRYDRMQALVSYLEK